MNPLADVLFELSWETCNKVGGIYTVISSKAKQTKQKYKEYFLIGPHYGTQNKEFKEKTPTNTWKTIFEEVEKIGVKCKFGIWNIPGKPFVILIDCSNYYNNKNEIKTKMWESFKVDSLFAKWDFDEPVLWSWAAAELIKLYQRKNANKKIILQAHEWLSGAAILNCKIHKENIATVFTTHATMLARTLYGNNADINMLTSIDPLLEAQNRNIREKHTMENALAHYADIFTTVSNITAQEAKIVFQKDVDVILYNGLDIEEIEKTNFHKEAKRSRLKLNGIIKLHFLPHYKINPKNCTYIFTSGRYEFSNKGMDILLDAAKILNEKTKNTIIIFFLVPAQNYGINTTNDKLSLETHYVNNDNPITSKARELQLNNSNKNKVKILHIPIYIEKNDGFFNENYTSIIQGCDLGIFASRYEPWGYTPFEALAYKIPAITTDQGGFAHYIKTHMQEHNGLWIIDSMHENAKEKIAQIIEEFCTYEEEKRNILKENAHTITKTCDWKNFIENYIEAHNKAIEKLTFAHSPMHENKNNNK